MKTEMIQDAVMCNFTVMGEAVKQIPREFRIKHSDINWKDTAGFRDVLIHSYLRVDLEQVRTVVEQEISELKSKLTVILSSAESESDESSSY